jgi:hypothetical protein
MAQNFDPNNTNNNGQDPYAQNDGFGGFAGVNPNDQFANTPQPNYNQPQDAFAPQAPGAFDPNFGQNQFAGQNFQPQGQPAPDAFDPYGQPQPNYNQPQDAFAPQAPGAFDPNFQSQPDFTAPDSLNQFDNASSQATGYELNSPQYAVQNQQFEDVNQPGFSAQPPYPDNFSNVADVNTFKEKKAGNNFVLIIIIFVIIGLAIASGVLFFLNQNRSNNNNISASSSSGTSQDLNQSSSSSRTSSVASSVSSTATSSTGQTPAAQAKIRNSTTLPADWLKQKFLNNGVDANTGVCQNANICGENADPDQDGLTNIEEYNYDTDPQNADTDGDGISDGNEVYIYFTSPRNRDSNGNSQNDFQDLAKCIDPITTPDAKMAQTRLQTITSNAQLRPLKDKTKATFRTSSATDDDILKGYIQAACSQTSTSSTASSTASTGSAPSIIFN